MSPAEVGALVYNTIRPKDFTATIIDLAYRGYLKIVENEEKVLWSKRKKYVFIKCKSFSGDESLREHETKFLEAIFGLTADSVEFDDLKNKVTFHRDILKMSKEILKKMVGENGYFSSTPTPKMTGCITAAVLASIAFIFFHLVAVLFPDFVVGKALFVSVFLGIIYLAVKPPPYTEKGIEAKWHALGFKEYLQVAEKFRLGACTPETFEQYLSYAIVFGVEEKWAARFADIYKSQPNWYQSSSPISGFNSVVFVNSLSSMTANVGRAISYISPSGSSGFGGGGGGGGSAGGGGGGGGSSAG